MHTLAQRTPWYREPWPWILMAGPLIVVVAGIVTAWIAYTRGDTVISEDYYRKGLAVQQTIASSERAEAYGLAAAVRLNAAGEIRVVLSAQTHPAAGGAFAPPPELRLTLSHPTRAGLDQSALLQRDGNAYVGHLHLPQSGHWLLLIESAGNAAGAQPWRMLGKVILPAGEVKISASAA